jgi:hypothetical protein
VVAMLVTQKIRMKKSNASSDQPRKQAMNVLRWTGVRRRKCPRNSMWYSLGRGRASVSFSQEAGGQDCVRDAGYLGHFRYVVHADDVRALQDAGCYRGCCAPDSVAAGGDA